MRFSKLLTNLILEQSRFQVLYDKMVQPAKGEEGIAKKPKGLMDFETLKAIIFADPTTRIPEGLGDIDTISVEDMEKVKVGKYTQWMLKNFVMPTFTDERAGIEKGTAEYKRAMNEYQRLFIEDLHKMTDDLKKYERFKNQLPQDKRDINKIPADELFNLVKDFKLEKTKASKQEKEEAKTSYQYPGSEIRYKGSNWTLIKIEDKGELGKGAAVFFGGYQDGDNGESRWCTSAPGLSYFNTYIKDGPLYVVLPNDDKGQVGKRTGLPKERYQFHFPSKQFMDRNDHKIDLVSALNGEMLELKDFFKSDFAESLFNQGEKLIEIKYPTNIQGKFAGLYGFNNIFDYIPENTQMITISNDSNEDIDLDVPSSIGKFKELNTLWFNNIVRTIPNEIEQLKKIQKLFLTNNKNLVSLPKSINNLPKLIFIRLRGNNPDLEIPSIFEKRLSDEGNGLYFVN